MSTLAWQSLGSSSEVGGVGSSEIGFQWLDPCLPQLVYNVVLGITIVRNNMAVPIFL